jgi:hypothetical protein
VILTAIESVHWCPVKYFAESDKSFAIRRISGIRPKNDLN